MLTAGFPTTTINPLDLTAATRTSFNCFNLCKWLGVWNILHGTDIPVQNHSPFISWCMSSICYPKKNALLLEPEWLINVTYRVIKCSSYNTMSPLRSLGPFTLCKSNCKNIVSFVNTLTGVYSDVQPILSWSHRCGCTMWTPLLHDNRSWDGKNCPHSQKWRSDVSCLHDDKQVSQLISIKLPPCFPKSDGHLHQMIRSWSSTSMKHAELMNSSRYLTSQNK